MLTYVCSSCVVVKVLEILIGIVLFFYKLNMEEEEPAGTWSESDDHAYDGSEGLDGIEDRTDEDETERSIDWKMPEDDDSGDEQPD
mgnify:CR=1 FL=1